MGRYYSGDIEGKFWFGVQSSADADYFGADGLEDDGSLEYHFLPEHLSKIEAGIDDCHRELGEAEEKLDRYFKEHDGYCPPELAKELGISDDQLHNLLEWYARLELGNKILECVKKRGECWFSAEL